MINIPDTNTCCEYVFFYDGTETIGEVLTAMIADRILQHQDEKALPKPDDIGYNDIRIPNHPMPGLREEAS